MAWKSLDYIVRSILSQTEEQSLNKYQLYLQYAIRGFRELNLQASTVTKISYLPISDSKSIDLPTDYVKYLKIGVVCNGHIILLGLDNSIALNHDYNDCGDPLEIVTQSPAERDFSNLNYGYFFSDHFHNGQWIGGAYGIGGGYNGKGYYRVNEEKNQIQLSSQVPSTEIVLEYISDGLNPDGSANVPVETIECLIAFVMWKIKQYKKNTSLGEIDMARTDYITEFNKLKHFKLCFSLQEYLDVYRRNVQGTVKR